MTTDTIAAIATAPGAGGIGIVRVSGPGALPILEKLFAPAGKGGYKPWILRRGRVQDTEGNTLDDSLVVFMPGPKTFTGEDVAEFQCHGGPVLLAAVLEACLCAGARLAERGEFTRRAFLNGRMDLTQAEAVAEMIAAPSKEGARLAAAKLDGVLGQLFRAGQVAFLLGHLGQVLDGDLVVHQNFHLTGTLQLRNSALGLDDRQRAGVSSCINMSHNRFSFR